MIWHVNLLQMLNGKFYVGTTLDLGRRRERQFKGWSRTRKGAPADGHYEDLKHVGRCRRRK